MTALGKETIEPADDLQDFDGSLVKTPLLTELALRTRRS